MHHPEEGLIHAWLDDALPEGEARAIEVHVASCAECQAAAAEARGLIAASSRIVGHLDGMPGHVIPTGSRTQRRFLSWRNPWIEGAVAAALIIGIGLYRGYEPQLSDMKPSAPPSVAPASTKPADVPAPASPLAAPQAEHRNVAAQDAGKQRSATDPVAGSLSNTQLPRASATVQRTQIAAAPPSAAPRPGAPVSAPPRVVADRKEVEPTSARMAAPSGARAPGRAVVGAAAGGATAPAAMKEMSLSFAEVTAESFIGCYDMNASTDVLPARFALTPDSASIAGLMAVRYVDADGRALSAIADLGWAIERGRAVVKIQGRETLLSMQRTGSSVSGEARSGARNGRVSSCSKP